MNALVVRGLNVHYGALHAIQGVDLEVEEGQIVFLVGPNGAGKSSLFRAMANVVRASSGEVRINGRSTAGLSPESVVRLGFTTVPEGREIFGTLTVEENLKVGAYARKDAAAVRHDLEMILDEFPILKARLRGPAGLLSGGEQQMLAIGRGLMTASRLIALDEPSLGLAPKVIDQIYEILCGIRERHGLTLIIAEQNLSRSIQLRARVAVLRNGVVVAAGDARSMSKDGTLEKAYFGF